MHHMSSCPIISWKAAISSSTLLLLNTSGGFIFNTFPSTPSRLTRMFLPLIMFIIFFARSPSSFFDYLFSTISMPWKSPTPRMSPTKLYFLNPSRFYLKYSPVILAFSCSFCHYITSSTQLAAVTARGFPPKVLNNSIPFCL